MSFGSQPAAVAMVSIKRRTIAVFMTPTGVQWQTEPLGLEALTLTLAHFRAIGSKLLYIVRCRPRYRNGDSGLTSFRLMRNPLGLPWVDPHQRGAEPS